MKNTFLGTIVIFGASIMLSTAVSAQEPKTKIEKHENKYKSEGLKVKEEKKESKYKSEDLKVKEEKKETKVKGTLRPVSGTRMTEHTEKITGKTEITPVESKEVKSVTMETLQTPVVAEKTETVKAITAKKKVAYAGRRHVAKRSNNAYKKTSTARRNTAARKYATRVKTVIKTVRDTVYVPSQPETLVSTEYVHDTVLVTRVDTVLKIQKAASYSGYRIPRGDFKKIKLKKDKDSDEVQMKKKMKHGKREREYVD
jgi:hypothetical protein